MTSSAGNSIAQLDEILSGKPHIEKMAPVATDTAVKPLASTKLWLAPDDAITAIRGLYQGCCEDGVSNISSYVSPGVVEFNHRQKDKSHKRYLLKIPSAIEFEIIPVEEDEENGG